MWPMHLGSQQIAPACVQSNLLGLGIGSWCCVVEPMLTELVKTTTTTTTYKYMYICICKVSKLVQCESLILIIYRIKYMIIIIIMIWPTPLLEHRFHEERERRQSTNKRNEGHGNTVSMRLIRVDTRYWHALGERYYLLILWRQLLRLAAIAGQCFGSILKVFNALIIVLPKVISGAPLGLL